MIPAKKYFSLIPYLLCNNSIKFPLLILIFWRVIVDFVLATMLRFYNIFCHLGPHEKNNQCLIDINQFLTNINQYLTITENLFYKVLVILVKY